MQQSIFNIIERLTKEEVISSLPVSTKEIQRVEKALKSYKNLGEEINNQTIDAVMALLQNDDLVRLLFSYELSLFRKAIDGNEIPIFKEEEPEINSTKLEDCKSFLASYLYSDTMTFIEKLIKINHYKCLYGFLFFESIIPDKVIEEIRVLLENKLEFTIEKVIISSNLAEQDVPTIINPYFFRCLNRLNEGSRFDDKLIKLHRTFFSDTLDVSKSFKMKGHYSFYFYQSINSNLNDVFKTNYIIALGYGIKEKTSFGDPLFKGELVDSLKTFKETLEKRETVREVKPSRPKNTFLKVFIILKIILLLFFVISKSNQRSKFSEKYNDYLEAMNDIDSIMATFNSETSIYDPKYYSDSIPKDLKEVTLINGTRKDLHLMINSGDQTIALPTLEAPKSFHLENGKYYVFNDSVQSLTSFFDSSSQEYGNIELLLTFFDRVKTECLYGFELNNLADEDVLIFEDRTVRLFRNGQEMKNDIYVWRNFGE